MDPLAVDPVSTPRSTLDQMVSENALRIAELLSKIEESTAELRRLRTRAARAASRTAKQPKSPRVRNSPRSPKPKKVVKSPRRSRSATQQRSPSSVLNANMFDNIQPDPRLALTQDAVTPGSDPPQNLAAWVNELGPGADQAHAHPPVQVQAARRRSRVPSQTAVSIASEFASLQIPRPTEQSQKLSAESNSSAQNTCHTTPQSLMNFIPDVHNPMLLTSEDVLLDESEITVGEESGYLENQSESALSDTIDPRLALSLSSMSSCEILDVPRSNSEDNVSVSFDGSSAACDASVCDTTTMAFGVEGLDLGSVHAFNEKLVPKTVDTNLAFDWNCYTSVENGDMPADITENYLLLEHI